MRNAPPPRPRDRERLLLGRPFTPAEVRYMRDVARRPAALRLMRPEPDANYRAAPTLTCRCRQRA